MKAQLLILLCLLTSCMHSSSINLKKKSFNQYPSKIIWIQLAGFDEEQIAQASLIEGEVKKSTFDAFTCIGMHWEFNSHQLNPPSDHIARTLVTGKSNIKGNCDDATYMPFWSYFTESDTAKSVIMEKLPPKGGSILDIASCLNAKPAWNSNFLIRLDTEGFNKSEANGYSVLQRGKIKNKGLYYDSSCNGDKCFNNLLTSVSYVVDELIRYEKKFSFVIRDFSAEKFLKEKKYTQWAQWIAEWNQVIAYIQNSLASEETLILVTGIAPIPIQIPSAGEDLKKWIKTNVGANTRPRSLFGKTWAMGARAENFCGLYKVEDLVPRIFWQNQDKSILGM